MSNLGKYSNDPATYFDEVKEARSRVVHEVDDEYVLVLDRVYFMFVPARKDGRPVPNGLDGKWKTVGAFKAALGRFKRSQ